MEILNEKEKTVKEDKVLSERFPWIKRFKKDIDKNRIELYNEATRSREILSLIDNIIFVIKEEEIIMQNENFAPYIFKTKKKRYKNIVKFNSLTQNIEEIIEGNKEISEEIFVPEINKYFFLSTRYLRQENAILFNLKDITKSHQFERIQKDFISNVSHELKTPLTNIKGYLIGIEEIMKQKKLETDRDSEDKLQNNLMIQKFLEVIYSNIEKIENLIQKFLGYSKFEGSKIINRVEVDVEKIMSEILFELNGIITEKKAIVDMDYTELYSKVMLVDKDKIKTVIKNLVENGIIYNKRRPEIQIEVLDWQEKYVFIIRDNGVGISEMEQEKIFDRFYRVENLKGINISGSGLGLSIVKEIIENYKGKIVVNSILKKGTEFKIIIPK